MNRQEAFRTVFEDLTKDRGIFTGCYDAKNGKQGYMEGIYTIMEYLAYEAGVGEEYDEIFFKNIEESERKAK